MAKAYRFDFHDEDYEGADRQTASLAGLAITLLIVVTCLFIIHQLHMKSAVEDCLLSGRSNCDVVLESSHWSTYRDVAQ
ncbi:MAG TPA: hypothetical protein VGH36_02735 [Acetobacteraceae bacterium]|jgi:uncharacterized membrane protein